MRFPRFIVPAMVALACLAPAGRADVVDVDAGDTLACALYRDGAVWCWGFLPGSDDPVLPLAAWRVEGLPPSSAIAAGRHAACAVGRDDAVRCWGLDHQRSMRAEAFIASQTPFLVEGLPPVRAVTVGYSHQCVLDFDGRVWCWGENACGEVGCGNTEPQGEPVQVPLPIRARSVSAGVNNTCAVLVEGSVSCWGSDNPTMPGRTIIYETTEPIYFDPAVLGRFRQVANGRNFACGIRDSGEVTCWGSNIFGQIGTDEPRLGGPLPAIGEADGLTRADDLDATYFEACAVQDGKVLCWGITNLGQDEDGDAGKPLAGGLVAPRTTLPMAVPGIEGATKVTVTSLGGCAVVGGRVLCWGVEDLDGQPVLPGMGPRSAVPVPGLPE